MGFTLGWSGKNQPFDWGPLEVVSIFRIFSLELILSEQDLPNSCREISVSLQIFWKLDVRGGWFYHTLLITRILKPLFSVLLHIAPLSYAWCAWCGASGSVSKTKFSYLLREWRGEGYRHLIAFHIDFQVIFLFSVFGVSNSGTIPGFYIRNPLPSRFLPLGGTFSSSGPLSLPHMLSGFNIPLISHLLICLSPLTTILMGLWRGMKVKCVFNWLCLTAVHVFFI